MPTLWNADDRASLLARFARLTPESRPRWGRFTASRMVTHITDSVRSSLGELHVKPMRGPLGVWPLNTLVMDYLPWPKSAPTAPELIARTPVDWPAELQQLQEAFDRFGASQPTGDWPRHAAFGHIGPDGWGRLMYRHTDHHLRQFGA